MNKRKNLFLLLVALMGSIALGMETEVPKKDATKEKTSQEEVDAARQKYYEQKTKDSNAAQELNVHNHSWSGVSTEESARQTVGLVFGWINNGAMLGIDRFRKYMKWETEEEKRIKRIEAIDEELKKETLTGQKLNNEAAATAKETKDLEQAVLKKQELNADIDAADKIGNRMPKGFNHPSFKKRWKELADKAGIELTEDDMKDPDAPKSKSETPDKDKKPFLSRITAPLTVALTSVGDITDFLAANSFAHITNLDCFKDTFVQANAKNINRALVAVTAVGVAFAGYKLYKKMRHSDEDEDLVDDVE
jgi:hypothetical protein